MANDFSGDTDVVALYRFEDGALTVDSKESETLTNNNAIVANTVTFKEGAASADLESGSSQYFSRADADLAADFPLKNGTSNDTFSFVGWVQFETVDASLDGIITKYRSSDGTRSFGFAIWDNDWDILMGYNGGASFETLYSDGAPVTGRWYHFKVTFDAGAWTFRLWDDTAGSYIIDASGTASNTINIEDAEFRIGNFQPDGYLDGLLDEIVIFKRVVSDADQDAIRAGTYSAGGGISIPVVMNHLRNQGIA